MKNNYILPTDRPLSINKAYCLRTITRKVKSGEIRLVKAPRILAAGANY